MLDAASAHDRTRVHANARREAPVTVDAEQGLAVALCLLQQRKPAGHRMLGVVFSGALRAESRFRLSPV